MKHQRRRWYRADRTRGRTLLEYIIAVAAIALSVVGIGKVMGGAMKQNISGQTDAVATAEGQRRATSDGPRKPMKLDAPPPAADAPAAAEAGDGKSISPAQDVEVGTKVTVSGVPEEAAGPPGPPPRAAARFRFFNIGWVLAIAGIVVFAAVMFKGRRMAKNSGGD